MTLARAVYRLARNQLGNINKVRTGRPVLLPHLGSETLDPDDVQTAKSWLRSESDWHSNEPVAAFESEFAAWNGSEQAFSFLGGRVALSACIHALGLGPGDEVIVPGYTCIVVANAFSDRGIDISYADIELDTYGLDVDSVAERIGPKTKAIMLQHLYGLVSRDLEAILSLAEKNGLSVIEDCAHSTGARFKGRRVGNFGNVAFYSSEQSKVFNTVRGGLAVTNDADLARRIREYQHAAPHASRNQVKLQLRTLIKNYYQFKHPKRYITGDLSSMVYGLDRLVTTSKEELEGKIPDDYGCKMPAPIAELGRVQLRKIDRYNEARRLGAKRWDDWCEEQGFQRPRIVDGSIPVFLRYPVLVPPEMKQDVSWAEGSLKVRPGVWFASHLHPAPMRIDGCPSADRAVASCINFPTLT